MEKTQRRRVIEVKGPEIRERTECGNTEIHSCGLGKVCREGEAQLITAYLQGVCVCVCAPDTLTHTIYISPTVL